MNRCEAPNCKMRTYAPTAEQMKITKKNCIISFHKFPDDPERRQSWISAANKPSWRPPMFNSSLCSLHFRDDCFNENNELYDNAVPTIFFDDFGYHMREVVDKLDLECKLDEDNASKTSKGSEDALDNSVGSNQSGVQSENDEDDIGFVECEEVVIFDENSKLGIENISIPELEEVTSDDVDNENKMPPNPDLKPSSLKIDLSDEDNVKISNSTNDVAKKSKSCEDTELCILEIDSSSDSTESNIGSSNSLSKNISVTASTTTTTNLSASSTKPPMLPEIESKVQQSNQMVSKPPIKSTELPNKPATVLATSVASSAASVTLAQSTIPSSASTISSAMSSTTSSEITPVTTSCGIASSQPTVSSPLITATQTKPTPTSSQSSIRSSIPPASTVKTTLPSSTPVPSKPVTPLSVPASNSTISRSKYTPIQSSFSIMDPSAKSLVVQLLDIVKTANASDEQKSRTGQCINSYLVTSKSVSVDPSEICEILPSTTIINNVSDYVKAIKEERFVQPKNVSIICGSPAIFLIKNVSVQECDPSMNCVYVITSQNLLPDLYKLKMKSALSPSCNQLPPAELPIPSQKTVHISNLVSGANSNAVSSVKDTKDVGLKPLKTNAVLKPANFNIPGRQNNSNFSSAPRTPTNRSTSNSGVNKTPANSFSNFEPKLQKTTSVSYADTIEPEPCTEISNADIIKPQPAGFSLHTVVKSPANSSNLNVPVIKPLANSSSLNATVAKPPTNAILNNILTRPLVNTSINSATLSKPMVKTVLNNVTPAKSPAYTLINNVNLVKPLGNTAAVAKPLVNTVSVAKPLINTVSMTKPLVNTVAVAKPVTNTIAVAKPLMNAMVTNVASTKPLVSIPISSVVLAKANTSVNNITLAKPLANSSISSLAPAKSVVNISIPNAALAKPTTTNLNSSPRGILCTVTSSIPNSPLSRVLASTASTPSILKSSASIPAVKISTPAVQPSIYFVNQPRPQVQSPKTQFQVPTTIPARTPAPPNPVFIPTPPATSAIPSKQPTATQILVAKSNSFLNSIPSKPIPPSFSAESPAYIFKPIQPSSFDTNLKTSELLVTYDSFTTPQPSTSKIPAQSTAKSPLKRTWGEVDDDDDDDEDDDDPFFASCNSEEYDKEYLEQQRKEIQNCESNILQKEREIGNLKKKVQLLKKRLSSVRNPNDTKTDEQLVEEILSKYIDSDGVQFFIGQMKVSGKTYTQFRWSEDDKLFALGLLYKNPVEYNVLFQKYTLPSDKTLNKFVNRVKKAEMQDNRCTSSR